MTIYRIKEVAQIADIGYRTLADARFRKTDVCGVKLPDFRRMGRGLVCAADDGDRFAQEVLAFKRDHITLMQFAERLKLSRWSIYKARKTGRLYGVVMPQSELWNNERWFVKSDVDMFVRRTINHVLNRER